AQRLQPIQGRVRRLAFPRRPWLALADRADVLSYLKQLVGVLEQTHLPACVESVQECRRRNWACHRMTYQESCRTTGRRPDAAHTPRTVLIVEDNELNMKLFHDLLDAHGYQTLQTRSGIEALKIARERRPDLILMDIQLPEVSGLEVTRWLKDDEELREI